MTKRAADSMIRRRQVTIRRTALTLLSICTTAVASFGAWRVLSVNGFHALEWPILPLFVVLVFPIALSFWTVLCGVLVQITGGDVLSITRDADKNAAVSLEGFRTAIVIPAYNEDAVRLFAGLKATYESVEASGHLDHYDFFLLSDTTDPDVWVREEMAFHTLQQEVSDPARLFYRNRRENVERKAGNIAEFCATWGGEYRYMVVFDADSIMTGESLEHLVRSMERHPNVGILQTPPVAVGRQSLFGRLLQFSTRAYGPLFIAGLNFWQAGEANYWGHNAIIRIEPFVDHCRLPVLPGKAPLGGSILSHDFVEAALMRRAGWKVYVASDIGGSYEEIPANLIGHAARDRRWCQGNLQHARLLAMPGLNWVNRVHLAMGVMSYAASPLWMLMLLFTTAEGLRVAFVGHDYFQPDQSPFPVWHVSLASQAVLLFTSVLSMLLFPKFLSLAIWLGRGGAAAAGFGGRGRMSLSVVAEILFSVLVAPVLAMLHSRFVIGTLMGRKVEWAAQDRGDVETTWRAAFRWHLGVTLLGLVWAWLLWPNDRALFWWLSPVLAGWLFSIPLSVWTSNVRFGRWARERGLFLTPEEVMPPPILRRFHEILQETLRQPWTKTQDGLTAVLTDAQARGIHLSLLPPPADDPLVQNRLEGLRLKVLSQGVASLLASEKRELLGDPFSLEALARTIGATPPFAAEAAPPQR